MSSSCAGCGVNLESYDARHMPNCWARTISSPTQPAQNQIWTCPRCGQVNAAWSLRCNCKPGDAR